MTEQDLKKQAELIVMKERINRLEETCRLQTVVIEQHEEKLNVLSGGFITARKE